MTTMSESVQEESTYCSRQIYCRVKLKDSQHKDSGAVPVQPSGTDTKYEIQNDW